jgi:hypothetical protein
LFRSIGESAFKTSYIPQQLAGLFMTFPEPLQATFIKLTGEPKTPIFGGCSLVLHTR